ncbi:isocitrate lyase/PEP mutase family protein [Novosphingobium lindaniclasticum]|uniref:Carboxyvinyl-carboxyphosphonate phosphorylmutase n=1 Tax=Novosphingobium lindaniclasticum LE124 TaxID=1096930 RepID=T0IR64_9SPHN|nr:isocitrate lyase/PEP mutase family protein [Novosphingobium lindaniclasticum]EQB14310.1 hypothetical protein L284_13015 [Novosphingobium lindaniclasticum LE124]
MASASIHELRALLQRSGAVPAPGIHDALGARIAAMAGHEVLYLGGNAMALGLGKGQPYLTLTETATITAGVARVVDLPLVVDAGAGFGAVSHLHLAVRELERAGATAIHIDDQPYPKQADYHRGRGALVPVDAMVARLRVACAARSDMLVFARTDALRVSGSLDEAIERAQRYAQAGIDGLIVLDLAPADVAALQAAVPGLPVIWIGGVVAPVPSREDLSGARFALALYPFNGVAAVSDALGALWRGLAADGLIGQTDALLAQARMDTLAIADMQRCWVIEEANG